jgi:sugar/nucleoside kinase (ribokinase family)
MEIPQFVAIGHVTRDLVPGGGWRLGGTVTYAALTAQRLGLRAGIVTSGPPDLLDALAAAAPGVTLTAVDAIEATTFENIYENSARRQYLRGRASMLDMEHVPKAWRAVPIVLLAPLAREVAPTLARAFPSALVAATPQGWLRRWDADGRVYPGPLGEAEVALPALRALIVSLEDLLPRPGASMDPGSSWPDSPKAAMELVATWARIVPFVAVTAGKNGASLLARGAPAEPFPAIQVQEVDPTGAGDVFAAAFLCRLHATGDPRAAMRMANRAAGLSIERQGTGGIPTFEEIERRFGLE